MNLLQRACGLSLLCSSLLATSSHAEPAGFTPKASLDSLFELEGNTPFSSPYDGTLTFSALTSKFATAHGHGYRNELKIATRNRHTIEQTREHFSAVVTPTLPNGAKTIVSQYHVDGLDTIVKVYVQDTLDAEALDGKAGDGVFDIVAKIKDTSGKDAETALGTIRSGESFALDIRFDNGIATVSAKTAANGARQTQPTRIKGDNRNIYFKFGDYFQAEDPVTHALTWDTAKWDEYFRLHHMEQDQVRFSHVTFVRD